MHRGLGIVVFVSVALAQRPSPADADAAIEKSRERALAYARTLPDFVCTEVIHRDADTSNRGRWITADKLTIKLSYFEQKEEHKLISINDKPTEQKFESLGGAIGVGEFGGTLASIFNRDSNATFHWESWKTVRKRRVAVYSYVVDQAYSKYKIATGTQGEMHAAVVGYHGVLELDVETGAVLHFTYQADHIPKELKLEYAITTVDYEMADVGGRNYLLPSRSETEMHSPGLRSRNTMEFREYRKFSTESTITFGPDK